VSKPSCPYWLTGRPARADRRKAANDPPLQEHVQFWVFSYNTSNPETILEVRRIPREHMAGQGCLTALSRRSVRPKSNGGNRQIEDLSGLEFNDRLEPRPVQYADWDLLLEVPKVASFARIPSTSMNSREASS